MVQRNYLAAFLLPLGMLMTGCSDPVVELHEPGEYTGKTDPLLQIADSPQHQQRLRERFKNVQTDR